MAELNQTTSIILLALAAMHFLLGVAVGWWFKDRRVSGFLLSESRSRAFLGRLHDLAMSVADDVSRHSSRIEEIVHDLVTPSAISRRNNPEAMILDSLSQSVMANKRLQNRLHSAEHQLQEQARKIDFELSSERIDTLTQMPNRRALDDELESRFARRRSDGKPFALMFVDIDHLKTINDEYGNDAGDRLLRHVGNVLMSTMRERDLVVRYGGEEFGILLTDTALPEAMRAVERALRALRDTPCKYEGKQLRVTGSAGVAEATPGDDLRTLYRRADAALTSAMESGGNSGYFHDGQSCHPVLGDALPGEGTGSDNEAGDVTTRRHNVYAQYVAALGVDARTDVLTGLPNRRAFSDELRRQVGEALRSDRPLSLMLVGVDNLGNLSAFQGQDAVDEVLRKVAQGLCAAVRDSDLVTRFGWEEFAVILPDTKYDDARKAHTRAQTALAACMHELHDVKFCLGLAELLPEDDVASFSKRVESALAKAKLAGGRDISIPLAAQPSIE